MKKFLKYLLIVMFVFSGLFCTKTYVVKADEILAFEKEEFVFDAYNDTIWLNMTIPTGYSVSDIKFKVEDEEIVEVSNYAEIHKDWWEPDGYDIAMNSKKTGETTVTATIDNTSYEAQCKVKVIHPITISWEKEESKTVVSIKNKCGGWFSDTDYQAVEMKVISLEDNSESDWIRLGIGKFGEALNNTYTYDVENDKDYKILVRWVWESPYFEEDYREMGVENEAIIYGREPVEDPPIEIIDDTWNFLANKEKIEINVGSSDKVEITAKAKEGLVVIAEVLMVKDNWDVEWKIEDETIAKCIPEKGIENNKYGGTQIAGRATIEGLKSGTTTLVAKVKVSENRVEEFKIPITVKDVENKDDKKVDKTVADKVLAKTGESKVLIIAGIIAIMTLVYFGIKIRNKSLK